MKRNDMLEIKGMWKKESLCCDRFAACYVDKLAGGYVLQESQPFLSVQENQINKHLAMIKKMLVTDIGGKLVQVPWKDDAPGILDEVRDCRLCNEEIMETFYEIIQDNLPTYANYEILTYHVVYDIPNKGTDGKDQGESDDVYEYILCMICPTKMTKSNLSVEEGRLGMTTPDRVLGAPVTGFIWPALDERVEDRESIIIYNADAEAPEHGLYRELGVREYSTTDELRKILKHIFKSVTKTEELADSALRKVTKKMGDMAPEAELTEVEFSLLLQNAGIEEKYRPTLAGKYAESIAIHHPKVYQLMMPDYIMTVTEGKKGSRIRNLLLRAAGVIEDVQGTESELVRDLLTAADMQAGGRDE